MSYQPYRDNKDLAGVDEVTQAVLDLLGEAIDDSSRVALHRESCGCDRGEACPHFAHAHVASGEETLGWLVSRGLLDSRVVVRWLAEHKR